MTKIPTLSAAFDWRSQSVDWPVTTDVGPGLAGVIAAETRVMWLDPASGHLAYRGVPIDRIAAEPDFEALAHLLITARDGDDADLDRFRRQLRSSRRLPEDVVSLMRSLDPRTPPMRVLRAGVSAMGCHELTVDDGLEGERQWRELRVVGQVAAMVADICRHRRGAPPEPAPPPGSSLAEAMLEALGHERPHPEDVRALDLLWVLYAAHGLDAPTFTSMIVASCLADPYFNVVAGLSALRGPRAGGAADEVLTQLLALDNAAEADAWVERTLAEGGVIAGFGHPAYRMPDPRSVILRKEVAAMARRTGRPEAFEIARAVEDAATRALAPRGVHVNINFYGALLFHLLGFEAPMVPCLMAVGRMAGTAALVREALDTIRLYRPLSRYVGRDPAAAGEEPAP